MARQQAAANSRTFRSPALSGRRFSMGFGSVPRSHSASVMGFALRRTTGQRVSPFRPAASGRPGGRRPRRTPPRVWGRARGATAVPFKPEPDRPVPPEARPPVAPRGAAPPVGWPQEFPDLGLRQAGANLSSLNPTLAYRDGHATHRP